MSAAGPLRRLLALGLLLALALPSDALACSVCYNPNEEARTAYLLTTGLLSLVPLGFIGGLILWIRARLLAREAEEAAVLAGVDVGPPR